MPLAVMATSGLPVLIQMTSIAVIAPAAPARVVVTAISPMHGVGGELASRG